MLGKKGMWTWNDFLYFILFYIPMTGIVVLLLLKVPNDILDSRLYSGSLDDSFLVDRVYDRISYVDWNTGRLEKGFVKDLSFMNQKRVNELFYFSKERPAAFKLSLGSKSVFINQGFYNISRPLAPVRYNLINVQKSIFVEKNNTVDKLNIELVSSKKKV